RPRSPRLPYTTLFRSSPSTPMQPTCGTATDTNPCPTCTPTGPSSSTCQSGKEHAPSTKSTSKKGTGRYAPPCGYGNGVNATTCRSEEHTSERQSRENL